MPMKKRCQRKKDAKEKKYVKEKKTRMKKRRERKKDAKVKKGGKGFSSSYASATKESRGRAKPLASLKK